MNGTTRKVKNWGFPYFFAAILLFCSIYVVRLYITKQNDPARLYARFQDMVSGATRQAGLEIKILKSKVDTNSIGAGGTYAGFPITPEGAGNGIALFLFRNDSLVGWSESKVILPLHFPVHFAGHDTAMKLPSGWYGFHGERSGRFLYLGCYLIRNDYPFQNEYLKNGFAPAFNFSGNISLTPARGAFAVHSPDGHYLFSLDITGNRGPPSSPASTFLVFLVFILGGFYLTRFLYQVYTQIGWFSGRDPVLVLFFCTDLLLLRLLQFYTGFPAELYHSELFGPSWYSSSIFLPSLGDFTINAMLVFIAAMVFYSNGCFLRQKDTRRSTGQIFINATAILGVLLFFQGTGYFITDLVINSSLPLNLQNISGLVPESGYGLVILVTLLLSSWFVAARVCDDLIHSEPGAGRLTASLVIAGIANVLIYLATGLEPDAAVILFILIYLPVYWYIKTRKRTLFSMQNLIVFMALYAIFATTMLNQANALKEKEKLNLLAVKLATRRNPVTEVLYEQMEKKLRADTVVKRYFESSKPGGKQDPDSLVAYLKSRYFKEYWRKYTIQVTLCDSAKALRIQPQGYLVNCNTYFDRIIANFGEKTPLPNLYFLDYGFGKEYYLAILTPAEGGRPGSAVQCAYIEINLTNEYPDPGYPGLLMDTRRMDLPNLSEYSYGLFQNGQLVHSVGNFSYCLDLKQYQGIRGSGSSFTEDGMIHYSYTVNKNTALLISKKEDTFLTKAAPFSYLFILFAVIALLAAAVLHFRGARLAGTTSLRNRLQVSLIAVLVAALLAIGIVQVINIVGINSKKNTGSLRERAFSVMIEVQHRYGSAGEGKAIPVNELEDFLIKLSNIFFTDINFYDAGGGLIASSRPQIFEEGLVSRRIDPEAYEQLAAGHRSIFIHTESIGRMQFNSAYMPLFSEQGTLLGYVNLPYFSKQDELKKEISSLLVTFINIYILVFLFGLFITILISNYITAPLTLLTQKMSRLRLGGVNDKISWSREDEIGQLVSEYNRMVEELERSADLLARSERESAWREMARQVAHEIKNPLTPMKLSVQYLQKAWNEKAEDWDQRLSRFTATLVEQIDTLSAIASDFSDFAKMPVVVPGKVDLCEVIRHVLSMYPDSPRTRYEYNPEVPEATVLADRAQLTRVFTNLINNAVQATGERPGGHIRISLKKDGSHFIASVTDNGEGMDASRAAQIFRPNFTTKTGGMGLGLSIVKGIIEGAGGEISFTSEEQKGTTFIIKIPAHGDNFQQETEK